MSPEGELPHKRPLDPGARYFAEYEFTAHGEDAPAIELPLMSARSSAKRFPSLTSYGPPARDSRLATSCRRCSIID